MILTINKSSNPYNGLNVHLRALMKTGLTEHKLGGFQYTEQVKYADMIILGNFVLEDILAIRQNIGTKIKLGYLFCSPFGQALCNGELGLLRSLLRLLDDNIINYLFCAHRGMVAILNNPAKIKCLPSISDFDGTYVPFHKKSGILLIGNNLRISRNFSNQLAALKFLRDEHGNTEMIYSYGLDDQAYEFFQDIFHIPFWKNIPEFTSEYDKRKIIAESKLGLQATYSDAFNIAAYEHAMCHTLCLISESLPWGIKECKIGKIDDPINIASRISIILGWESKIYEQFGTEFRENAKKTMDKNFELSKQTLKECL